MKLNLIIVVLLTFFILGCSKDKAVEIPRCELCNFAESLNGTYKGIASGVAVYPDNPSIPFSNNDSITIIVSHIFLHQNQIDDSTNMYFLPEYWYEMDQIHKFDTLKISSLDGYVQDKKFPVQMLPSSISGNSYYKLNKDSIQINVEVYDQNSGSNVPVYFAKLYKQ